MSEFEDNDLLAAEFVLGTLDPQERTQFEDRLEVDTPLKQAVTDWEYRLSPLLDMYAEVAPPPHLLPMVINRVFTRAITTHGGPSANILTLKRKVKGWRIAAVGAMALAAALAAWIVISPPSSQSGRFVAVLQKDANSPAILLSVDVGARRAFIRQVASEQPSDKSYELWIINPELGAPRSLGVLQAEGTTKASLAPFESTVIARATYAITLEPHGGSPTGAPSGPPILSGKLVDDTH